MEPVADLPAQPSNTRRGCCAALGCLALVLGLCAAFAAFQVFAYPIRARLTSYDTRLSLGPEQEFVDTPETRSVLRRRLRRSGIPARIQPGGAETIVVDIRSTDRERLLPLLLRAGGVRFMIVADSNDSDYEEGYRLAGEGMSSGFELVPYAESGREPALLRGVDTIEPADFAAFYRTLDNNGNYCVGFTLTPEGARRFFRLTSTNVGKQLAILVEGEVLSAPVIRAAIGRKGIIEVGQDGWTDQELSELLTVLEAGHLPQPLVLLSEERLGE